MLTTPLIKRILEGSCMTDKEGCFRLNSDEKLLFWEQLLEASKFIVGSSFQSSIICNNICHWVTELAVVPELMGKLQHPEHPPGYATVVVKTGLPCSVGRVRACVCSCYQTLFSPPQESLGTRLVWWSDHYMPIHISEVVQTIEQAGSLHLHVG